MKNESETKFLMLTQKADTENTNKTLVLNENEQLKRFILFKTIKTSFLRIICILV